MKRYPGMMIAATVALSCTMILASLSRAEETPVEYEISRAIVDPCHAKLEFFVLGGNAVFGCPGCTSLAIDSASGEIEDAEVVAEEFAEAIVVMMSPSMTCYASRN